MKNVKHKELLTRKQCHKTLCAMYSLGYTVAISVATVVFLSLTALVIFIAYTDWSDKNLFSVLLCLVAVALDIVLLACTIHVYRFFFPIRKGDFLIVEDELKYVRENVNDLSFQPRIHFPNKEIPYHFFKRLPYLADRLTFSKTGSYVQRIYYDPLNSNTRTVEDRRPDYFTCGRVFYVVVLKGHTHRPLLVYNANDYEMREPLDHLD